MHKLVAKTHPFFGDADGTFLLARRDGQAVGRIAFLEPRRFNRFQQKRHARFYFFESEDSAHVSEALFEVGRRWAKERDLDTLIGPQGFSAFSGSGILIDGFEHRASMTMMPYHLPYYRDLVEGQGCEKYKDFYSALIREGVSAPSERYERAAEIARKRSGLEVPDIRSKRELKRIGREVVRVYNDSWHDHEEFVPLSEDETEEIIDDLLTVTVPSLVRVFRAGDEIAGFVLAFPDLSRAMIRARGRLTPGTIARLMLEKRRTTHYLVNGLGILPKYRNSGGLPLLFADVTRVLREHGAKTAEMTQIAETTDRMLSNIEKLGAEIYKTHRIYQKRV